MSNMNHVVLAFICISIFTLTVFAKQTSPNVVIILTDDQGWGDLSIHGNRDISTPHIDSLARDGAQFERFYVSPVCSPTRAEMLTGRYHLRTGVNGVSRGAERLNTDEVTIADVFKASGYTTGAFGKWHNGSQWPYHPNARGFDEYYGFCSGHWGYYFSPQLEHNGKLVKGNGYIVDDFTDKAIAFIEENKNKPFLCFIPLCTPHSPMQVPDKFWKTKADKTLKMKHRYESKEDKKHTRAALAMCENIDWNVGRVLQKLKSLELEENTIVMFFSDNGPNGWRWNGGMEGVKGSTNEGGVRSPLFVRYPAKIKAGTFIPQISAAIDLLPTLSDYCELKKLGNKKLDGVSLKPLIDQKASAWPERKIFSSWRKRVSVRTQQYRLDQNNRLFDMIKDPGQKKNIAKQYPDVAKQLKNDVKNWLKEVGRVSGLKSFTVGHPNVEQTFLPARDGISHGSIKRSSRHPNCSFFTNWTKVDDKVTWDIEVLSSGTYEIEIHYTCKQENVGAKIQFSYLNQTISKKVSEAFDPPLRGMKENKVYKHESYVKDWKSLSLGQVKIEKSSGIMSMKAVEIPGKEAIDLRYVNFKKVR